MSALSSWQPVEPNVDAALGRFDRPLSALAAADIPAVVLRRAYEPANCRKLIDRFIGRGLMRDLAKCGCCGGHLLKFVENRSRKASRCGT